MTKLKNKTVLLTGGAAGIGYEMCKMLLSKGVKKIIIWDINQDFISDLPSKFQNGHERVRGTYMDVTDTNRIVAEAEKLIASGNCPDILINNAGIIVGKDFAEHQHLEIDNMMNVNIMGAMHVTLAFLPAIISRGSGHIVNVASAAGLTSNPKMSVYVASKWAMTGWSDSLRIELEHLGKDLHVTTVNPYYINTGMFSGVQSTPLLPILEPESVASKIIKCIETNKLRLRMPFLVKFTPLAAGLLPPRLFDVIVGGWFGIYRSMDHFTGHKK